MTSNDLLALPSSAPATATTRGDRSYSISATATFPPSDYSSVVPPPSLPGHPSLPTIPDPFDLDDDSSSNPDHPPDDAPKESPHTFPAAHLTHSPLPPPPSTSTSNAAPSPHLPLHHNNPNPPLFRSLSNLAVSSGFPSPRGGGSGGQSPLARSRAGSTSSRESGAGSRSGSPSRRAGGGKAGSRDAEGGGKRRGLSFPQLINPGLFLPLPGTDPLSPTLMKYLPPASRPRRDSVATAYRPDSTVEELLTTRSWRALAALSRDRIVQSAGEVEDVEEILKLYHLRHASLLALHLTTLHSRELNALFTLLSPPPIPNPSFPSLNSTQLAHIRENDLLPFELEVMLARTRGVDGLVGLIGRCKRQARRAAVSAGGEDEERTNKWKERGEGVGKVLQSVLVNAGEPFTALSIFPSPPSSSAFVDPTSLLHQHRLHLSTGDLASAASVFSTLSSLISPPNAPSSSPSETKLKLAQGLAATSSGDWAKATSLFREILATIPREAKDAGQAADSAALSDDNKRESLRLIATNALAVTLLYTNDLDGSIATLQSLIASSPSATLIEPIIFNLATLYELRYGSNAAMEKKIQNLLLPVGKWSGDGLRPACLKLP